MKTLLLCLSLALPALGGDDLPSSEVLRGLMGRFAIVSGTIDGETVLVRIDTATGKSWVLRSVEGKAELSWFQVSEAQPGVKSSKESIYGEIDRQVRELVKPSK